MASKIEQEIARMTARGEAAAVVSISHLRASAPSEARTRMLVRADGSTIGSIGGGEVEARLIKEAINVIEEGKPRRVRIGVSAEEEKKRGMEPGGKLKFFIEPILSIPHLYIFGGGNIPLYLARFTKLLDFKVTVIDNDPEFANPHRFAEADAVLAEDFGTAFSRLKIDESSCIVVATRSHEYDEPVLALALNTRARYIGVVRSRAEKQRLFSSLLAKGVPPELLDKVHCPIGLDISAKTIFLNPTLLFTNPVCTPSQVPVGLYPW